MCCACECPEHFIIFFFKEPKKSVEVKDILCVLAKERQSGSI